MPDADLSDRDAGAVLELLGVKPISIMNMMFAATALGLSLYTFFHTGAVEHKRELFGGYILGYTSQQLELCEAGSMYEYAQCGGHAVTNADFKSLNPILDSLLQIPVDWPPEQIRKPGKIGFPADPDGAQNIVTSALIAHYEDQTVQNAFFVGSDVRSLLALSDDPATKRNSPQRTVYSQIAAQTDSILRSFFGDLCGGLKMTVPSHEDIIHLNSCLQAKWESQPASSDSASS